MGLTSILTVCSTILPIRLLTMYLISRSANFAKLFFLVSLCGLIMYIALAFYTFHSALTTVSKSNLLQYRLKGYPDPEITVENTDFVDSSNYMKYILLWTTPEFTFDFKEEGEKLFIENDCAHLNCFLTTNKSLLGNITKFDAIVYSISVLKKWKKYFPKQRSAKQKYVLFATISASDFPICNMKADGYFNWTWTYKLHSDISTPFIEVKDLNGHLIAPSLTVEWPNDLNNTVPSDQPNKRKAVLWHDENCENDYAKSFAKNLQRHLKEHGMELDIYGCNNQKCPKEGCGKAIENVYFYLAFESSISDDYVTKEVLKGYHNGAVPIVVGGANYGKFLPPGSYIDARNDSPDKLASLLGYIARSPAKYNKFFSWKNHYIINEANLQRGYCTLCALLNNKKKTETHSSYETIRKWWYYGNLHEKCYPKGAETFDEVLAYIENPAVRANYMPYR